MGDVSIEMRGNLVNQLVNGHETVKKKPKKRKTKIPREPSKPRNQGNETQILDAIQSVIQESEKVPEKLQKQEDNMLIIMLVEPATRITATISSNAPLSLGVTDYHACRTCYKDYIDDILKCTLFTRSYYDCIQRAKQQTSSADM
ncbi:hypothetical protein K2173_006988 [Erythroxylum novogranatense]|uniref:Uncharacterized protein n=1 Tax=Erythroxylum novogranatense TaxID=1862640 RepID=A0AAV8S6M8_9ROSI|nr:hypothetical protein K2173_006988 [Erythroxylum novogranatense]